MKKKRDFKNATCWLSGWRWQGECVSGSCERLSEGIWVNMEPSPWYIIVKSTHLRLYLCVRFLRTFARAYRFPVAPAWLISQAHSSISFGPPKQLLEMKGTKRFCSESLNMCVCVCVCAARQLPVCHCLDRIMSLHTERGGDMPKAARVDNSPRHSFAVTENQKLVSVEL